MVLHLQLYPAELFYMHSGSNHKSRALFDIYIIVQCAYKTVLQLVVGVI